MKYINVDKLKEEIERFSATEYGDNTFGDDVANGALYYVLEEIIPSLQQEETDMGEVSDGYHTFNELYYYRMLYNAAFFNLLPKEWVHKSKRHHTGEECFGGGWFIVMANLPTGQISNHYELKDWDLFQVPEKEFADEWDGHTPQEAAERLREYLQQEQSNKESLNESQQEFVNIVTERMLKEGPIPTLKGKQKAEFEKEFNRFKQIAGMVNWPSYEEIYKKIILWFMAWGAYNLPNLGKSIDLCRMDIQQEQHKSRLIQVKCIHPHDESWEKDKAYTCNVWHHNSLNIDFWDVYYDYGNNPNYVQFSSIEMLNKEFIIVQQKQSDVDLEKFDNEVTKIWGRCAAEPNDTLACLHIETFIDIAHHFYNLGINAGKV